MAPSLSESLSFLLAATVAFAIGTSVVLRDRKREQFVLFAVFCFNLGLYHLAGFFYGFSQLTLFQWFAHTVSLLLPWTADRCFSSFVAASGSRFGSRMRTAIGVLLLLLQTVGLLVPELTTRVAWDAVPIALAVYVIGGLLQSATRMWRAARAAAGTAAAPRLRYLFYATLAALAFGSPIIPALGPIVTAVYLYFVAQTLTRERLLDLPEVVGRIASMTIMVVLVTALYALLLLWVPSRGGGRSLFLFNAAVASFAVIMLVEPVRTEMESRIEHWLFRDRPILRSMLVHLRQKLMNVIDTEEMVPLVIEELRASNRVTHASIYLPDRQGTSLLLRGSLAPTTVARLDLATRRPLLERMRRDGPQLRDELQRLRDRSRNEERPEFDEVLETMAALGASLAVPILGKGTRGVRLHDGDGGSLLDLLGALFVNDERLLEPFSREEVQLFEGVAAQCATTIQNSAVYEERRERERLAALGEMAAGLAHEIRNPLGAIKGAVQVLQPGFDRLDAQTREFLLVIVEEVDRLNRVVSQFLSYSRPFKGEFVSIEPVAVIQATMRLLDEPSRVRVTLDDSLTRVPKVRGDADALRQVFHNLVLNALDATAAAVDPGHVWISATSRRFGLPPHNAVAITVRDDGEGLSAKTMSNLFVPFHTTKSGGTGLGLPISQRIVENHDGRIEAANDSEGGARFTVLLQADESSGVTLASEPSDRREHSQRAPTHDASDDTQPQHELPTADTMNEIPK